MRELIVAGFQGHQRANQVLSELRANERDWASDLEDAVSVYRDENGGLRLQQSYDLGGDGGARWGALWGSLIGVALTLPLTAGGSAVAAVTALGAAALAGGAIGATATSLDPGWWHEEIGIPESFAREIEHMIQPGGSALFVLVQSAPADSVAEHLHAREASLARLPLNAEQAAKIETVLHARAA
jgi:uncharacterized membrane protein